MELFDTGFAWIAGRFGRVEPRRRARAYLLGLLADVQTRTCWQLAEHAGEPTPHGMQRLLGEAVWDADAVRDDVRGYVADELGDPEGVLIIDDTGDLKKGVRVAGTRWSIETCFQTGKGLGLDEHQVRRWDSWYRHTTLVMLAHAILTVIAERARHRPGDEQLVSLSINEIRRLLAKLAINAVHTLDHWLGWSNWRRRHQARAKTSHIGIDQCLYNNPGLSY